MQNCLQFFPFARITKHTPGKFTAPKLAIPFHKTVSKDLLNFFQGGLSGFNQLPGEQIGVNQPNVAFAQQPAGCAFAHADAAG